MMSREVIQKLEEQGWRPARVRGSHHYFRSPVKGEIVILTVPHPVKELASGIVRSIFRQAGITP